MENHETECYILQSLELLADLATSPDSQYCGTAAGPGSQPWVPHTSLTTDVVPSPCKLTTPSVV